ncbi:unnamed protein product [Penicillium manginii]
MSNRNKTDTAGAGLAQGSSTGAPGIPTGLQDQRAQYDPATTGVNPATGAPYTKSDKGASRKSFDVAAGDDRIQHAPSTTQRVQMEEQQEKAARDRSSSSVGQMGKDVGRKAQGVMAGVHGALNSAVDRAFGSNESAEWNEEITRREEEMRTGRLGKWT